MFLRCVQVPLGPLAFMPGKLVHTNEVTALLGDNWFAKCSAKQARSLVEHRMKRKPSSPGGVRSSRRSSLGVQQRAAGPHCWLVL